MIRTVLIEYSFMGIFSNLNAFVTLIIMMAGGIGLISKKLVMGAMGSFLVFVYIATNTQLFIFENMLYVILAVIIVIMGLRAWNYANSGGGRKV